MGQQRGVEIKLGFASTRRSGLLANGELNGKMVRKSHMRKRGDRQLTHVRKGRKGLSNDHSMIQPFKNPIKPPSKVGLGVLDVIRPAVVSIWIKKT